MVRVATHNKTNKKVAIKEVYTADLTDEQLADLDKEMCILSQLRHSNICGIAEVYKTQNHTYLVRANYAVFRLVLPCKCACSSLIIGFDFM